MSHLILENDAPIIKNKTNINGLFSFNTTDTEKNYAETKIKLGPKWYYHDSPITYKYNSWGYRTKEFSELADNYLIAMGCSFTEGVGLYYNDMWSTKIGKVLGLDVLNLGMGGTSVDFHYYNTLLLFDYIKKLNKIPKLVIYQWPNKYRTTYSFKLNHNGKPALGFEMFSAVFPKEVHPPNSQYYWEWYKHAFMDNEGELIKQTKMYPLICNILWSSIGVKVINWTWEDEYDSALPKDIFSSDITIERLIDIHSEVKARDLGHAGHLSQNLVVDYLVRKLN